ncbi:MAG TPA: hypothetical protein VHY91_07740 [Pirellulales bacterium]|jgi:hypothetical protein|nr:hypothetical protein [Pirellulales bacterium]
MSRLGTVGLCALVLVFFAVVVQAAESDPFADSGNAATAAEADDEAMPAEDENEVEAPPAKADDAKAPVAEILPEGIRPIEVAAPREATWRAKILMTLEAPTEFDFTELPLTDVVKYLSDKHEIEIQLDTKALEAASIGIDTPVTRSLRGISLRSFLRLMLGALDLTYTVKDGVLLITTPEVAKRETIVRIYPVGDLIAADAKKKKDHDFATLIEVIKGTALPDTWQDAGGIGRIEPWVLGQSLVIRQTLAIHDEIEPLLAGLRRSRDVEARRNGDEAIVDNR